MKYHLMRLRSSIEITKFPLLESESGNFFCLKYEHSHKNLLLWNEHRARFIEIFPTELHRCMWAENLEC